jgi:hypothetical protein
LVMSASLLVGRNLQPQAPGRKLASYGAPIYAPRHWGGA